MFVWVSMSVCGEVCVGSYVSCVFVCILTPYLRSFSLNSCFFSTD